jgi:integrase
VFNSVPRHVPRRPPSKPRGGEMKPFTNQYIKALSPKLDRYQVQEPGGLGLRVTPNGTKTFFYRYNFFGRPRRMTLGVYPEISLKDAREQQSDAKKLLNKDIDPGEHAIVERKREFEAETVKELVNEYLEKWAKVNKKSWKEDERVLNKEVIPRWGNKKAKAVTRRDVISLLDTILARGAPGSANQTFEIIRRMFRFGIERDLLETTPCYGVRKPAKSKQRDRVLTESEIKTFWGNVDNIDATTSIKLALKLKLITAQRRGEIAKARWSEVDLETGWWTIPSINSKNQLSHRVPLSSMALNILKELKKLGAESDYLLPSPVADKPIDGHSITRAVVRNREEFGIEHFTPHDLRRTAASHMTSIGISRLVVSKILNHAETGVTAVYDRHSYDKEKRIALESWERKLESIITDKDNIILLDTQRNQKAQ